MPVKKQAARVFRIDREVNSRKSTVAVRRSMAPKACLQEYFEQHLEPHDYTKPLYKGNTVLVLNKRKEPVLFSATDVG